MKTKKLTKVELKEKLQIILNTVLSDNENTEHTIISNEVFSSFSQNWIELNDAGRALALEKNNDENHIIRKLIEVIDNL